MIATATLVVYVLWLLLVFGLRSLLQAAAPATPAGAGAVIGPQLQVRRIEEPHLLRVHGQEYRAYAAQVGRSLPGIGKLPSRRDHTPWHP